MGRNRIIQPHLPRQEWITCSPEETLNLGIQIGKVLLPNAILCFFGDLGSGKTTLIKGIVNGATGVSSHEVTSPTYVYMTPYYGPKMSLYHFDLYRLGEAEEFLFMGFDEYFAAGGICCIEWSERILPLLPQTVHSLHIEPLEIEKRRITSIPQIGSMKA